MRLVTIFEKNLKKLEFLNYDEPEYINNIIAQANPQSFESLTICTFNEDTIQLLSQFKNLKSLKINLIKEINPQLFLAIDKHLSSIELSIEEKGNQSE